MKQPEKIKKYGSIPHLPGSKLGPGDHHVDAGQNRICTEAVRDKHDWVIVQEKYDGANVGVENNAGQIIALTRRGFLAKDSNFEQHRLFAQWVEKNSERFRGIIATNEPGNSPEGLIYRVERLGKLIFLAKYVRHDFEPGAYLPEMSGRDPVWNFNISNF